MTIQSLLHSTNGTKATNGARAGKVVPLLGPRVDHLLELRGGGIAAATTVGAIIRLVEGHREPKDGA